MVCTEKYYIENATSLLDRLDRYDAIIEALENQFATIGADNSDVQSYSLNDGQVTINTMYRDPDSIAKAIERFTSIREKIVNKLNGRSFALRSWRGLS